MPKVLAFINGVSQGQPGKARVGVAIVVEDSLQLWEQIEFNFSALSTLTGAQLKTAAKNKIISAIQNNGGPVVAQKDIYIFGGLL